MARRDWVTRVLPAPSRPLSARHAADLIIAEARAHPGELTLVTLGPMTNLAVAVLREPALPRLLRRLVLMGGAYGAAGNTTPVSEWNVAVDPEAMAVVLRAWSPDGPVAWGDEPPPVHWPSASTSRSRPASCPSTWSGWRLGPAVDQTDRRWTGSGPVNPVIRYLADALAFYFRFHERFDGFTGAFIHDPLALAAALDPDLVQTRPVTVEVELGGT